MTGSAEHFQYLAYRRRSRILLASGLTAAILFGLWLSSRSARRHWMKTAPVTTLVESANRAQNDHELVFTAAFRAYKDGRNDDAYRLMSGLVKRSPGNAE